MKSLVTLILGGNRGDRKVLLDSAVDALASKYELVNKSSVYETEAWGGVAKGLFLNQIIQIKTDQAPLNFLAFIQQVEMSLGRVRDEFWGDRTMDIDILFWDDLIIDSPTLKIPHPYMKARKFVLEPLNELSPDFTHPVLGKTINDLLQECKDKSKVRRIKK